MQQQQQLQQMQQMLPLRRPKQLLQLQETLVRASIFWRAVSVRPRKTPAASRLWRLQQLQLQLRLALTLTLTLKLKMEHRRHGSNCLQWRCQWR
jgi:hypothetical protein